MQVYIKYDKYTYAVTDFSSTEQTDMYPANVPSDFQDIFADNFKLFNFVPANAGVGTVLPQDFDEIQNVIASVKLSKLAQGHATANNTISTLVFTVSQQGAQISSLQKEVAELKKGGSTNG
ncbi:hypothetical protein M3M39_04855 [Fructilactobacillus hinvesii]|uniref:Uncharacterized protein n=1 Tax=Fructilactobacillus hinvesii TaxID=2940300 RepID=A0ABY5BSK7_9LACO|nr:hypothetical protein [Fructilactobacillus hinvesii]USS87453.1 hypothetical protein M3M39_04855 [Fructilactobacillus hinvesii]